MSRRILSRAQVQRIRAHDSAYTVNVEALLKNAESHSGRSGEDELFVLNFRPNILDGTTELRERRMLLWLGQQGLSHSDKDLSSAQLSPDPSNPPRADSVTVRDCVHLKPTPRPHSEKLSAKQKPVWRDS